MHAPIYTLLFQQKQIIAWHEYMYYYETKNDYATLD